jgi:hypothetical protein
MNLSSSSIRSLLSTAIASVMFWVSLPNRPSLANKQNRTPTQRCVKQSRSRVLLPVSAEKSRFASGAESEESSQFCRSRQTEVISYGTIRLIDVGDDVQNLADFLALQANQARANDELCLIAAISPSCPSCAAIGYSLAEGTMGRALGSLTLIRVDVEEFDQDLRQVGLAATELPVFALISDTGRITQFVDSSNWSSNSPAEFLSILSDFVQRRPIHHQGGRHSPEKPAMRKL